MPNERGKKELGLGVEYVGLKSDVEGGKVVRTNFLDEKFKPAGKLEYKTPIPATEEAIFKETASYLAVDVKDIIAQLKKYAAEHGFALGEASVGLADFDAPDDKLPELDKYLQEATGKKAKILKV